MGLFRYAAQYYGTGVLAVYAFVVHFKFFLHCDGRQSAILSVWRGKEKIYLALTRFMLKGD